MRRVCQCWRLGSDTPAPAKVRQVVGRYKLVSICTRARVGGSFGGLWRVLELWQKIQLRQFLTRL